MRYQKITDTTPVQQNSVNSKPANPLVDLGYEGDGTIDATQRINRDTIYNPISTLNKDDELIHTLWSNGIYRKQDFDDFNTFYIFPRNDPFRMVGTAREYVFITKPDLHIFGTRPSNSTGPLTRQTELNQELVPVPFFNDLYDRGYKETVLKSLNYSADGGFNPFVNILSNYRVSNLDLSGVTVGDEETSPNIFNTRIYYRKPSDSADEEFEFTLEFKDNKYLDCYLWFKAYDMYERLKYQGKVSPYTYDYVFYKTLSDQMSIFKFIVAEDGSTILYWAQMWGCYPKSVPRSAFSDMPTDGMFRFTVDWKSTFQADMEPLSILHFNNLVSLYTSVNPVEDLDLWDPKSMRVTGEAAVMPYITTATRDNHKMYQLRWFRKKKPLIRNVQ